MCILIPWASSAGLSEGDSVQSVCFVKANAFTSMTFTYNEGLPNPGRVSESRTIRLVVISSMNPDFAV